MGLQAQPGSNACASWKGEAHLDGADVANVLDVAVAGRVQRHVLCAHCKPLPVLGLVAVGT